MFCRKCGSEVQDGVNFCQSCGSKIGESDSPSNEVGMKKCPMCGEQIQESAKKCRYCGEYIAKDESHTVVSGPNGDQLFSKSTYSGEPPVQEPINNHETLCFWLGFSLLFGGVGIVVGTILSWIIGGKDGLIASLKGAATAIVCAVVLLLLFAVFCV